MKGKVISLMGGAGGICSELALHFLDLGANVVIVDINKGRLDAVADKTYQHKHKLLLSHCDVTDIDQLGSNIRDTMLKFGRIDVLVNGVGLTSIATMHDMTMEGWRSEVETNLNSAFYASTLILPIMRAQMAGSIINLSSVNALIVLGNPAYSAAKAGLLSLTRSIALEYGSFGIRCNALCLGTVRTEAWKSRVAENPKLFEQLARLYSIGKVADPHDLTTIVQFLASDGAKCLNGSILAVDGGLTAGIPLIASEFIQREI